MKIKNQILILFTLTALLMAGCSKDDNDTTVPSQKTRTQLLAARTWQVGETYQSLSGSRTHYLRGGENTSGVNMDVMRLKFNTDGTGTNTDISGTTYNMTWSFTTADERNMRLIVNGTVTYDWIFTEIDENVLLQISLVSTNGLVTAKWIPVP